MCADELTVAVLSDIHAYDPSGTSAGAAPSYVRVMTTNSSASPDPFEELRRLISDGRLSADMLLCPGDLGDRAEPKAVKHAWEQVQQVGQLLKCREIVATAGNHDVDSRHKYTDHDAKGFLQSLKPLFPFPMGKSESEALCHEYWSQHFAIIEESSFRLVVLNSAAYHGEAPEEIEYGRISQHTLTRLKERLKRGRAMVNLLLCHHHPLVHAELDLGERDTMRYGHQLLDLLADPDYGSWIVIHGHKHHPRITYAQGRASSAVVFAAGSFSAQLYPTLGTAARNQFYLISLPLGEVQSGGIHGTFRAWDWIANKGWQPATKDSGLPGSGGFGCRSHPSKIAAAIAGVARGNGKKFYDWNEIRKSVHELDYILPNDFQRLVSELENTHGMKILFSSAGIPTQLGF